MIYNRVCKMTSSDKAMDRALASMPMVAPLRSEWVAIEACLDAQKRRRVRIKIGFAAIAASLLVAVVALALLLPAGNTLSDLQQTVDAAIRDARPKAAFSGHEYRGDKPTVDALLVSAKPREGVRGKFLGEKPQQGSATPEVAVPADAEQKLNEF